MRRRVRAGRAAAPALLCAVLWSVPALARTLTVGPGGTYPLPSEAANAAQDGDSVVIAAGEYFDCAIWRASRLTIEGSGTGAVLTDMACGGKASFVITGDDVTLRHIVFRRVRVPDGNGAGIRAEGRTLLVEDCGFDNDQVGVLAGGSGGTVRILDSRFTAVGASQDARPAHAVLAGRLDRLEIERSSFATARSGGHVVSDAAATVLIANRFADEGGAMRGPLVWIRAGTATLRGNVFTLAPGAADRPGLVLVSEADAIELRGNTLTAPDGRIPLLRNWSAVTADAADNVVPAGGEAVSDAGVTYRRLRTRAAGLRDAAMDAARLGRHLAAVVLRGLGLIH